MNNNITVTMPIEEYERLKDVEDGFFKYVSMFENANIDGEAIMTNELRELIEGIFG